MSVRDSFIIVGGTGTGKSDLSRKLCDLANAKKVYFWNNDFDPDENFAKNRKIVNISSLNDLRKAKSGAIIFEDVIQADKKTIKLILETVNFRARHFNLQPCLILTHSLVSNDLSPITKFPRAIIFLSNSPSSLDSLEGMLKKFQFSDQDREKHKQMFLNDRIKFNFYVLNCAERTFKLGKLKSVLKIDYSDRLRNEEEEENISSGGDSDGEECVRVEIIKNFTEAINGFGKSKISINILKLMLKAISIDSWNKEALVVRMRSDKKSKIDISVVDFILSLNFTDIQLNEEESKDFKLLFKYIRSKICIPKAYVTNSKFR